MRLKITNTTDHQVYFDADVVDLNKASISKYYSILLKLPAGCPAGEYRYELVDGDNVSTGLMMLESSDSATFEQYDGYGESN